MTMPRYIISLVFLLAATGANAQLKRYVPTGLRLGVEAGAVPYLIFSQQQNHLEFTGDMDFNRFYAVVDYGQASYKLNEDTYRYNNSGSYMRFGGDVNFLYKDPNLNMAFFGVRYAISNFHDQLDYNTNAVIQSHTGWPSSMENSGNNQASAHWIELDAGLRIRIYKQLFFGFTGRYKLSLKAQSDPNGHLRPYYVPGFGKFVKPAGWGLSYYVYWRIPFRKKVIYEKRQAPKPSAAPVKKKYGGESPTIQRQNIEQ